MAFPVVAATALTGLNASLSHLVNLPGGIASGNLLLVQLGGDGNPLVGFPADWTEIKDIPGLGDAVRYACAYRIADGLEGGTIPVTFSVSEELAAQSFRITSWHGTTPPEISAGVTGQDANPNPDLLTPSWGPADTLWFSTCVWDSTPTLTSGPVDYTNATGNGDPAPQGVGCGTARRERNIATEDPGTFTISASNQQWTAATIAVRPAVAAPSLVVRRGGVHSRMMGR